MNLDTSSNLALDFPAQALSMQADPAATPQPAVIFEHASVRLGGHVVWQDVSFAVQPWGVPCRLGAERRG